MFLLGISCDYHDAAAALIHDGKIVAAVEEERLSRLKHDNALPDAPSPPAWRRSAFISIR